MSVYSTTRWSLVRRASDDGPEARRALGELLNAYGPAIRNQLSRSRVSGMDIDDLYQEFCTRVIESDFFAAADPDRGSLRAYLKTALNRFANNQIRGATSQKRGGAQAVHEPDSALDGVAASSDGPDKTFDQEWASATLAKAIEQLKERHIVKGKGPLFEALAPYLGEEVSREEFVRIAAAFGARSNTISVAMSRLRQEYQAQVRSLVMDTVGDSSQMEDELAVLRSSFLD